MSHFSVAVFTEPGGKTLEQLLAPFHEFECTGIVDEYVQSVDQLAEALEEYAGYVKETNDTDVMSFRDYVKDQYSSTVLLEHEEPDLDGTHKWGWMRVNDAGEVIELIRRTNPNKKWDWYMVGGRWSDMILNLAGNRVDSALIKEIDWNKMREEAAKGAELNWEAAEKEKGPIKYFEYRVRKDDTKETYLARQTEFVTYAVITPDGVWHAKGEMGWFGISSDTLEEANRWAESFMGCFIKNANPELTLTIVDCHI